MEEYKLLGIEESTLAGLNPDDMMRTLKKQYKIKLGELIIKIREVLDDKVLDDEGKKLSPAGKLEKIDDMQEDIFACASAFSRLEKRIKGEAQASEELQSIKDEVKSVREMLNKTIKFSQPTPNLHANADISRMGVRSVNAYQALAISENDELNDQKVVLKTILLMDTAISKKPPYTTDESEKMLFRAFKYMWAYSKLKTPELRKDYYSVMKYTQMLSYSDVQRAIKETSQETLTTADIENPQTAAVNFGEEEQSQLQITEKQKLSSSVFTMTTGSIIKYLITRMENGEITEHQLYSIIDMKRLETDPNYREKMIQVLTDDKNIKLAQRHLGGYIGVVREENGAFTIKHALKHIGLCVNNQREKKKQRENANNQTPQQQDSGEGR